MLVYHHGVPSRAKRNSSAWSGCHRWNRGTPGLALPRVRALAGSETTPRCLKVRPRLNPVGLPPGQILSQKSGERYTKHHSGRAASHHQRGCVPTAALGARRGAPGPAPHRSKRGLEWCASLGERHRVAAGFRQRRRLLNRRRDGGATMAAEAAARRQGFSRTLGDHVRDVDLILEQDHHAPDAVASGNSAPMKELISRRDDVTLAIPLGPPVRGPLAQLLQNLSVLNLVVSRDMGTDRLDAIDPAGFFLIHNVRSVNQRMACSGLTTTFQRQEGQTPADNLTEKR